MTHQKMWLPAGDGFLSTSEWGGFTLSIGVRSHGRLPSMCCHPLCRSIGTPSTSVEGDARAHREHPSPVAGVEQDGELSRTLSDEDAELCRTLSGPIKAPDVADIPSPPLLKHLLNVEGGAPDAGRSAPTGDG